MIDKNNELKECDDGADFGKFIGQAAAKFGLCFNKNLTPQQKQLAKQDIEDAADAAELITKLLARLFVSIKHGDGEKK